MNTLLLLLACSAAPLSSDGGTRGDSGAGDVDTASNGGGDTDADTGVALDSGDVAALYGDLPADAIALPEFSATNRDGTPRSRDDLLGHPTVMWFYPLAQSGG